jgi:hypothetical protein
MIYLDGGPVAGDPPTHFSSGPFNGNNLGKPAGQGLAALPKLPGAHALPRMCIGPVFPKGSGRRAFPARARPIPRPPTPDLLAAPSTGSAWDLRRMTVGRVGRAECPLEEVGGKRNGVKLRCGGRHRGPQAHGLRPWGLQPSRNECALCYQRASHGRSPWACGPAVVPVTSEERTGKARVAGLVPC